MSRDSYYKYIKRRKIQLERDGQILELVKSERLIQPRSGCKKLYRELRPKLEEESISIGRDRFIKLVVDNKLEVKPRKKFRKTTYSNHNYAVSANLVKDLEVTKANQVFVCDITYIQLRTSFCYLFLATDLYSRKIVGYDLRADLRHEGALNALKTANVDLESNNNIIIHSDRGCQYCCHEYIKFAKENGFSTSMTDQSHCYQNAVAERVNGILKDEFYLDLTFKDLEEAKKAVEDAINIYNKKRRHWSLDLRTPDDVYYLDEEFKLAA